jgi:CheY-like chemotaxis protein
MDDRFMQVDAGHAAGPVSRPPFGKETESVAPQPGDRPGARRRRVLVVDDSVDAAHSLGEFLRLCGHEARVVTDAAAALGEALAFGPEVVLLDIGMPTLDGFAVAERLRAEPALRASVLIALTGFVEERDVARSREAGFDHHLSKPLDFRKLLSLLAA